VESICITSPGANTGSSPNSPLAPWARDLRVVAELKVCVFRVSLSNSR
jgi:hypothetical protein